MLPERAPSDSTLLRNTIEDGLASLSALDCNRDLIRTEELGEAGDFRSRAEQIAEILSCIREIASHPVAELTVSSLILLKGPLQSFQQLVESIQQFSPTETNSVADRATLLSAIESYFEAHVQTLEVIATAGRARQAFEAISTDVEANRMRDRLAQLEGEIIELRDQAEAAVTAARNAAGLSGVAGFAEMYDKEAGGFETGSRRWLFASASGLIAACIWAVVSVVVFHLASHATATDIVNSVFQRVGVLTLLLSVTFFGARNFRISRHNALVIRQKRLALETAEAFTSWVDDATAKNAVILQLTQFVFSSSNTGYIGDREETTTGSVLMEMARAAVGSKQ